MDEIAIEAEDVQVRFAGRRGRGVDALRGVSLRVARREVVGLLGPNGSGKTTMIGVLTGEIRASQGTALVLNHAAGDASTADRIGVQPDAPLPFPHLTGRESLAYHGALLNMARSLVRERSERLLAELALTDAADRPTKTYSAGMRKRLGFAIAILGRPDVLILDEPTAGLDPVGSERIGAAIRRAADAGCAVLLASHHLQEVEQRCDRICLLSQGSVAVEGPLDDVLGRTDAVEITAQGIGDAQRPALEAAVVDQGGTVTGWRRARRHLFALFRDLERRDGGAA